MRMWQVSPQFMCRNHLLGEHCEYHKHRHTFEKKHSKTKYIENNCLEPKSMESRHNELVKEMQSRGYNHNSPFVQPDISYLPLEHQNHKIDAEKNLQLLLQKCPECKKLYERNKK